MRRKMKTKSTSKQNTVRKSFLEYLKNKFPLEYPWVHPTTKRVWSHKDVEAALLKVKELNNENYKVLWGLWTTGETTEFLSQRFHLSTSVIKHKWEKAVNLTLLLLLYPNLHIDLLIYSNNN